MKKGLIHDARRQKGQISVAFPTVEGLERFKKLCLKPIDFFSEKK